MLYDGNVAHEVITSYNGSMTEPSIQTIHAIPFVHYGTTEAQGAFLYRTITTRFLSVLA
jgi:hypothetical protein